MQASVLSIRTLDAGCQITHFEPSTGGEPAKHTQYASHPEEFNLLTIGNP
jgi:hypothetical protein